MVVNEFRQMRRDHRALAMMIVLPLLMLVVFGYAASFDVSDVPVRVVGPQAEQVASELPDTLAVEEVVPADGEEEGRDALVDGAVVAVVVTSKTGEGRVLVDGSQLFSARAVANGIAAEAPALQVEILFNPDLDTSAVMVPAIAGMILVFIGTVITSLGMVRERTAGTLEQLSVMPFRPRDVLVGKIAPYFAIAALDLLVVIGVGVLLFDVPFNGSPWLLALGSALFLLVTLGIGLLVSSVSENSGQAIQLALMTLLPQVLLSGMIFPLEAMAAGIRWLAYILPLTYFVDISRAVMLRGASIEAVAQPLALLAVLGTVVFGLALLRTRRDLVPVRRRTRSKDPGPDPGPEREPHAVAP
ncbi:MAG: ABC transporter permease [Nitriliruptoraceae bacterium]